MLKHSLLFCFLRPEITCMHYSSLETIRHDLAQGKITVVSLVQGYLDRIAEVNPTLNLFIEVFEAEALARAKAIDARLSEGKAGVLAGMVVGIKDVICMEGHLISASSRILQGFESQITATVVERLLAEDAIIIGRQNCDEFAMGSSNENSFYGPARLPADPERVTGGSSGGSAASVAAGCCLASLGSDTGGSVRQPAGFCGVYGVKPTYGRISRWGLIAYASSFDQIGPLTRSVADAALLLQVMAGPDGKDHTSSQQPVGTYFPVQEVSGEKFRIAYLEEAMTPHGLDPEVYAAANAWLEARRNEGHEVKPISFPLLPYLVPCYYLLTTAEASSNLQRFDGIRYGYRANQPKDLRDLYVRSRTEGFGEEVKKRILLGAFVLSAGFYEAYYQQAQKVRRIIRDQTTAVLEEFDFIFSPTSPSPAFKVGEKSKDPISMYLADIFTVHANLAGIPACSFPMAFTTGGLPIGGQLSGKPFEEGILLGAVQSFSNSQ